MSKYITPKRRRSTKIQAWFDPSVPAEAAALKVVDRVQTEYPAYTQQAILYYALMSLGNQEFPNVVAAFRHSEDSSGADLRKLMGDLERRLMERLEGVSLQAASGNYEAVDRATRSVAQAINDLGELDNVQESIGGQYHELNFDDEE